MDTYALAEYVKNLIGDRGVERVAYESGISRATVYNLLDGKPPKEIRIYESLALGLGVTRDEQRDIFKTLLRLSGNLKLITDEEVNRQLDARVLREIERRFPEVYQAALALVQAQERGELPKDDKGNQEGSSPAA